MVGVTGFEPATSPSRTSKRATGGAFPNKKHTLATSFDITGAYSLTHSFPKYWWKIVTSCFLGLNPGKWTRGFNQDAIASVADQAASKAFGEQ